jgi:hypothetical protein
MTDRLRDDQLDNDIRSFLAWRAEDIGDAPTATEVAMRIKAPSGTRTLVPGISAQLAWLLIAALLVVALIGAAVAGANLLREDRALVVVDATPTVAPTASLAPTANVTPTASPSYEAVFLRLETVGDSRQVIVVAVNAEGHEREIARPPGAWYVGDRDLGAGRAPMGAVSPSGLLAIPSGGDNIWLRWKIFDLRDPQAEPTVVSGISEQRIDQPSATPSWHFVVFRGGVFWGPGDRLGIVWYDCPVGCDEHDRQFSFVDGRTGAATTVDLPVDLELFPLWTSDGSGVFVETASYGHPLGDGVRDSAQALHPDGSVIDQPDAGAIPSCITKYRSGAEITLSGGRLARRNADGWVEEGGYSCLAPDESMVVRSLPAFDENPYTAGWGANTRIVLGDGASVDVEGSFAGFMEVGP